MRSGKIYVFASVHDMQRSTAPLSFFDNLEAIYYAVSIPILYNRCKLLTTLIDGLGELEAGCGAVYFFGTAADNPSAAVVVDTQITQGYMGTSHHLYFQ